MTPRRGGQSAQSGISYQNSVAALYMGRLCDNRDRKLEQQVTHVRVEAPEKVDDIVVTFADEHRLFVQAKENVAISDQAWKKLWRDFEAQYLNADFKKGVDRLRLQIGTEKSGIRALQGLCDSALTALHSEEWIRGLSNAEKKLLENIKPILSYQLWTDEGIWSFCRHIEVEIWTRIYIERDLIPAWMPSTNKSNWELFRWLRDRVGEEARIGGGFTAQKLRASIQSELKDIEFEDAPDITRLRQDLTQINATLYQHKSTWGQTGAHLKRAVITPICEWLASDVNLQNNVAMLIDQAGMGKTVVMQDILRHIEAIGGTILALKADQQLSGVMSPAELQEKLSLSHPIEEIVERLAKLDRVVVLIDQLDALSLTLAHDEKALNLALELLAKLRRIPNVAILVSCRLFDRNSDPRLRHIEVHRQFVVSQLGEDEIKHVLSLIQVDYNNLSKDTRDLLATPLHLSLFVYAIESGWSARDEILGISSLQELYANLWRFVIFDFGENAPSQHDRYQLLHLITEYMDKEQKTVVPSAVFYSSATDNLQDSIGWLASKGILIESKQGWTFLHQTFFDYCFARFFVERRGDIVEEIIHSPQGLFERSKLVQVLSYLRGHDHSFYMQEFQRLLGSPPLRFHLQDLLIRWFGSLPNPREAEWDFARRMLIDSAKRSRFLAAMQGNPRWFDWLATEFLPNWLSQEDDFLDSNVIRYLTSLVDSEQQARVIAVLKPYLEKGNIWLPRIYTVLARIQNWQHRDSVLFLEQFINQSPTNSDLPWHIIHDAARQHPDIGCRFIILALNRAMDQYIEEKNADDAKNKRARYLSFGGVLDRYDHTQFVDVINLVKESEPRPLLDAILSWLDRYYALHPVPEDRYWFISDEFSEYWNSDLFKIRNTLINSLVSILADMAKSDPGRFKNYSTRLSQSPFVTPQRALARVYSTFPEIYAREALMFLLADARRLTLGGYGLFESRRVIRAIFPHLSKEERNALETHVLNFDPIHKVLGIRALELRGLDQLHLLQSIPPEMLSPTGLKRLHELERKFPNEHVPDDEPDMEASLATIGSPIPREIAQKMTDKNWLSAMRKYKDSDRHRDFLKGGARELSTVLLESVKRDPSRFYALLKKAPDGIDDSYVTAFINGFAESDADPEMLFYTIRRFAYQPKRHIRQTIAWVVQKSTQEMPVDVIAFLRNVLSGPMGEDELWWSKGDNHGSIFSSYSGSDRGSAFEALMRVLSRSDTPAALDERWTLIESITSDPSSALRAGAIHWLTDLIRHDRNRAISTFEQLIIGHEVLLTLRTTREFIYWSLYKNFSRLGPYIKKMMESDVEAVQEQGSQLACIAAISPAAIESEEIFASARQLVETILKGTAAWRRGAARIFSFNLTGGPKDACQEYIVRLIDDEDEKVRNYINGVFHSLKAEHIFSLRPFVEAYSKSSYALTHYYAEFLLDHGLLDPHWSLQIIRTTLENKRLSEQWHSGIEELIRLVLKIYVDPTAKVLQNSAMDVFDMLMEKYSNFANRVLDEWDHK